MAPNARQNSLQQAGSNPPRDGGVGTPSFHDLRSGHESSLCGRQIRDRQVEAFLSISLSLSETHVEEKSSWSSVAVWRGSLSDVKRRGVLGAEGGLQERGRWGRICQQTLKTTEKDMRR